MVYLPLEMIFTLANSADHHEMPHSVVSHLISTIYLVGVNPMVQFIQMHFRLHLIMEANIMNPDQTASK